MKKILIIDDEPDVVHILRYRLEKNNYEVSSAVNGAEGLVQLEQSIPDLIILDVIMPRMNGLEFLHKLRESDRFADIKVIVLTGEESFGQVFRAEGIEHYLVKPFDSDELMDKVEELVEKVCSS